jgi:hypothetical protein
MAAKEVKLTAPGASSSIATTETYPTMRACPALNIGKTLSVI